MEPLRGYGLEVSCFTGKLEAYLRYKEIEYDRVRTAPYRVWRLEQMRELYEALRDDAKREARETLEAHHCWEPLWRVPDIDSGIDRERSAPFGPGHSMTGLRS